MASRRPPRVTTPSPHRRMTQTDTNNPAASAEVVSFVTIMGPAEIWFCHGHGTRVLPLMGPPGVASRLLVVRPLWSLHGLPGGVRDRSKRDLAAVAGGPVAACMASRLLTNHS
jgi:hypothetical protein